jgi:cholesterol transport system auxiliary component
MRPVAAALAVVILGGCLGGQGAPPTTYFVMADLTPASVPAPSGVAVVPRTLAVSGTAGDAFYDVENLVFSRAAGSRAYYQFAAWTDRPSRRVATLVERRLESRKYFVSVSSITAGVSADVLLNVIVEELFHDLAVKPPVVRVQLAGEVVDWRTRTLMGRRSFAVAVPVAQDDAKSAVDAINRGVSQLLDELVPWVEATAGGPSPTGVPATSGAR